MEGDPQYQTREPSKALAFVAQLETEELEEVVRRTIDELGARNVAGAPGHRGPASVGPRDAGAPVTQAGRLIQASCTEGRRTGRHRRRLPPHGEGRSARFRARARGGSFGRDPRLGRWDGSAGDEGDGGASHRLLGRFLRWMQDRPPGVFVVATANDVASLPAEFLRKGRFDEIFFVDLPRLDQRREIFRLHLTKMRSTLPLSRTRAEEIGHLRAWASDRTI